MLPQKQPTFEIQANLSLSKANQVRTRYSNIALSGIFAIAMGTLVGVIGISAASGLLVYDLFTSLFSTPSRLVDGIGFALAYVGYGISLMMYVPALNSLLRLNLKPYRGDWNISNVLRWYLHNGLHYIVRYTFLEWTLLSPLSLFYYRAMGAKIGKNAAINTSALSDLSLISIGEGAFLGGSVAIMGHYSCTDYLNLAPVVIGKNAAIGTRAVILAGVTIGENARVLPNSYVAPNTKIPANEIWAGVPAVKIGSRVKTEF